MEKKIIKKIAGFTLIELLVAMTILGILSMIGLANFRSSLRKSRDARRKSDLAQVQRALEMYISDYGVYPSSNSLGQIVLPTVGALDWKQKSVFIDSKSTLYMKELPNDPSGKKDYCYLYDEDERYYKLYAMLENAEDPQIKGPLSCAGVSYNFGVSSSNTSI